jgi:hypothetical protein
VLAALAFVWRCLVPSTCASESVWNKENRFTGWKDVPLSDKGIQEAAGAYSGCVAPLHVGVVGQRSLRPRQLPPYRPPSLSAAIFGMLPMT